MSRASCNASNIPRMSKILTFKYGPGPILKRYRGPIIYTIAVKPTEINKPDTVGSGPLRYLIFLYLGFKFSVKFPLQPEKPRFHPTNMTNLEISASSQPI